MSVTIDDLVTGAQTISDKINDPSVSTANWYLYGNAAIEEIWRLITEANPNYFDTYGDQTVANPATPYIDLTASPFTLDPTSGGWTVRKIRMIEKDPTSSVPIPVVKRTLATKDTQRYPRGYIFVGKKIYLDPPTVAPGNYRVYYSAGPTILGAAGPVPAELIPYREYCELAMALRALEAEKSDTTIVGARLDDMRQQIVSVVADQDSFTADRIQDTLANDELQRWGLIYPGGWF
jgi:hypothetical protein